MRLNKLLPSIGFAALFWLLYSSMSSMGYLSMIYLSRGVSLGQMGTMTAICGLVGIFSQFLWGSVSDRTSRRTVLCISFLGTAAASLLYLKAYGYLQMQLVGILFAVTSSGLGAMIDSLALSYSRKNESSYSILRMFGSIGYMIFPFWASIIIANNLEICFVIAAALHISASVIVLFIPDVIGKKAIDPASKAPKVDVRVFMGILRRPNVTFTLLNNLLMGAGMSFMGTYQYIYIQSLGYDPNFVVKMVGGITVLEIAWMMIADKVVRHVGALRLQRISAPMMALRMFMIFIAGRVGFPLPFILLGMAMQCLGYAGSYFNGARLMEMEFPNELKSTSQVTLSICSGGISRLLGSMGGGLLAGALGLPTSFVIIGVVLGAGFLALNLFVHPSEPAAVQITIGETETT